MPPLHMLALLPAIASLALLVASPAGSESPGAVRGPVMVAARPAPDSAQVAAAVRAFAEAMRRGDSAAVVALLAPDAIILESGGAESRLEYQAHHLPGDLAFAAAVARTGTSPRIVVAGDVAWAWATGTVDGEYRGRAVRSATAELMVLSRDADQGWRIRAVHWSSRPRR